MKQLRLFQYLVAAFATITGLDVGDAEIRVQLHLLTGIEALKRGKVKQAIRHLREAVALDPSNNEARLALGKGLLEATEPHEAMEHLIFVLANEPDNAEAQLALFSSIALKRFHKEGTLPEA